MFGIGYDNMDQSQGHIGCDLLDIGSRRAATRGRCAHQPEGATAVPTLKLGEPGAFDLPNVPDVSGMPLALVGVFNTYFLSKNWMSICGGPRIVWPPRGMFVLWHKTCVSWGLGVFRRTRFVQT